MKNFRYTLLVLMVSFLANQQVFAQIRINQLGLGLSSWSRTYSGADERILFIEGFQSEDYKPSALLPNVFVEVGLTKTLGLELRAGIWENTFSSRSTLGNDIVVDETIKQRVTPVSLGLNYTLLIPNNENFFLNLGLGYNRYFIQNEASREVQGTEGSVAPTIYAGKNNGFYGKLGIEYRINEKLGLALQGRQHFGHYTQNYKTESSASPMSQDIDLKGFELGLSLAYRLENLFANKDKKD
jgi:outer membrane protein W